MIQNFQKDKLQVKIFSQETEMADVAAEFVAQHLRNSIRDNGTAHLIVGTGTSQISFLEALKQKNLDWSNIILFHLDEYIGISDEHPASFRKYLHERVVDDVQPGETFFLRGDVNDLEAEINRYEQLLRDHPIDVACIGIGENGHIAFNDPPVADFRDPKLVKVADLDEDCRMQQVGEGWFDNIEEVPKQALTLTIPAIMQCNTISCLVPGRRKAVAVQKALRGSITTECPASILRSHPDATLFLEKDSAFRLRN